MGNYNYVVISRVLCALIPDSEKVKILSALCEYWSGHVRRYFTEEGYNYFCQKLNELEKEHMLNPEVWEW